MRQVVIHPGEAGSWIADVPSLPGCTTQGRTKEEAIVDVREAIHGYVAALDRDGLPVPEGRFDALLVAV
jgi:predicted RNase H-like HicB family nuclease